VDDAALLDIALDAAREAARITHAGWRTHPDVEFKGRIDLVTRYDRESERVLKERLAAATPYHVVGEETGVAQTRAAGGPTWYVDPLDGTTNFVHGHPFYCVSVGLVVDGAPKLGAVVAPALGCEWAGIVGAGATRNGAPCHVSGTDTLGHSLLATGFPYDRATSPDNNFREFIALKKIARGVRRCGSAAIDLCFVADGTYDGYWEKRLSPWDLAAGAALVVAAGGRISDLAGGPADLATGNLIASNGKIHDAIVDALKSA
jgi:myo-inositol-1(or 4)-monophosphatase